MTEEFVQWTLEAAVAPRRRLRAAMLAPVVAILVVLGIAAGVAVWPRSDAHDPSRASGSLNDAARSRIARLVHTYEHAVGGGPVARVEVVRSTHRRAVQAIMDDGVPSDYPVWVVQLTAATVFHAVITGPAGANTNPTVKYVVWVLNARTFQSNDSSIGDSHADLAELGSVTSFRP